MADELDRKWDDFFTIAEKGRYWSELYDHPTTLFEFNMVRRRDTAVAYLTDRYPDTSDIEILDLGCGAGVLLEKLIPAGFDCTGADRSQDMLEIAGERLKELGVAGQPNLQQADALSLPFEADSFDVVAAMGMFGYFDDVDQALSEIRRVLRPGGLFMMSVRNLYTLKLFDPTLFVKIPYLRARSLAKKVLRDEKNFRIDIFDRPSNVVQGIERAGFDLEDYDGFGFGSLAFNQKRLLADSTNIRVSEWIDRTARRMRVAKATRRVADVNMYMFTTSDDG